jgi:hypothetical protein
MLITQLNANMLLSTALIHYMIMLNEMGQDHNEDLYVLQLLCLFMAYPEEDVTEHLPKILNTLSPSRALMLLGFCMYITFTLCCDSRSYIGPDS